MESDIGDSLAGVLSSFINAGHFYPSVSPSLPVLYAGWAEAATVHGLYGRETFFALRKCRGKWK